MSKAFDKVWHEGLIFKLKSMSISDVLLELIKSFLTNKFQRVVLDGQASGWLPVNTGVLQRHIICPLFFLIYDLSVHTISAVKLSLFSIVHNPNTSANELNKDFQIISEWAYQGKTSFNPDQNKQAQEVVFSRKITKLSQPQISVNKMPVVFC